MLTKSQETKRAAQFYEDKIKELTGSIQELEAIVQNKTSTLRVVEEGKSEPPLHCYMNSRSSSLTGFSFTAKGSCRLSTTIITATLVFFFSSTILVHCILHLIKSYGLVFCTIEFKYADVAWTMDVVQPR